MLKLQPYYNYSLRLPRWLEDVSDVVGTTTIEAFASGSGASSRAGVDVAPGLSGMTGSASGGPALDWAWCLSLVVLCASVTWLLIRLHQLWEVSEAAAEAQHSNRREARRKAELEGLTAQFRAFGMQVVESDRAVRMSIDHVQADLGEIHRSMGRLSDNVERLVLLTSPIRRRRDSTDSTSSSMESTWSSGSGRKK